MPPLSCSNLPGPPTNPLTSTPQDVKEEIAPAVITAFLQGDREELEYWCVGRARVNCKRLSVAALPAHCSLECVGATGALRRQWSA